MQPIGYIESCFKDRFGTPRQPGLVARAWSQLKIDPKFQPVEALQGLEGFSHVWLIFLFHENTNLRYHAKVHPPRLNGKSVGVFSTRSPHRPNPIGLSLVELESINEGVLTFRGADLVDGTPILDIKPFLQDSDSPIASSSGWLPQAERPVCQVVISGDNEVKIKNWETRIQRAELREVIISTLSLDPRPNLYRQEGGEKYRSTHAVRLFDGDVHFRYVSEAQIEIVEIIQPISGKGPLATS